MYIILFFKNYFQNLWKVLWHYVVIYPLINKTESRNTNISEPKKMEFLYYLHNFLPKQKLEKYYVLT